MDPYYLIVAQNWGKIAKIWGRPTEISQTFLPEMLPQMNLMTTSFGMRPLHEHVLKGMLACFQA